MRRWILLLLLIMLTGAAMAQAGWRQIYAVKSAGEPFGSALGVSTVVFLSDSNCLYKLTHLVTREQSMDTVIARRWCEKISAGEAGARLTLDFLVDKDGDYKWTLPFRLRSGSVIYYNNAPIFQPLWEGIGSDMLVVYCQTKKYDHLFIIY